MMVAMTPITVTVLSIARKAAESQASHIDSWLQTMCYLLCEVKTTAKRENGNQQTTQHHDIKYKRCNHTRDLGLWYDWIPADQQDNIRTRIINTPGPT